MSTIRQELEGETDLGAGHHWFALDSGDALWHDGKCPSWHQVDLTSGERHRFIDPFTVVGSLPCHVCGAHGYVREGRWVDA